MTPDAWLEAWRIADGLGTVGTWVLLGLAISRGWLVPARIHDQIVSLLDSALAAERTRADEAEDRKERGDAMIQDLLSRLLNAVGEARSSNTDDGPRRGGRSGK